MASIFDSKYWNDEVFTKYMQTVPRVKQNALLTSGVLRNRSDLKARLVEQAGGNYITEPITGRIGGEVLNYDGETDITATGIGTYIQSKIVFGRAKAWQEKDFTADITGKNFMEDIAAQVGNYWDDVDQEDLLAVLRGIFGVNTDGFSERHTLDLTQESADSDKVVGPASLNNAIQKAAGANKNIFTAAIMHSQVATDLENLELLSYRVATDANGIQRKLNLADWNGRTVIIDDDMVDVTYTGAGVYSATVGGTPAEGDTISLGGVSITLDSTSAASATAAATALKTAVDADAGFAAKYTTSRSGAVITVTEKSGAYGVGEPAGAATGGSVIVVETTTAPASTTKYETFLLGQGAIDFCDCGAKVPSETKRDATTDGGVDMLITRQRHLLAPIGFSYIDTSKISPMAADLKNPANWALVSGTDGGYFPSKAIALARIISLG